MIAKQGYDYVQRSATEVHIFHLGKMVKLLRGDDAASLLKALEGGDAQTLLAEAAGAGGSARPGVGSAGPGQHLHGNGAAHTQQQFRRKSG